MISNDNYFNSNKTLKKIFEFNNTTYLYKILEWGVLVTYMYGNDWSKYY